MEYASQVRVLNEGGTLAVEATASPQGADAITLILGAGTSYASDAARRFNGAAPLPRCKPGGRSGGWPVAAGAA
jgi:alpha-L-fucosidase 2